MPPLLELLELEDLPPLLELLELEETLGLPPLELDELLELDDELLELEVLPPLLEPLELDGFPPLELEEELPVLPPLLELDDELLELDGFPPLLELELDEELLELDELLSKPPELEDSPSGTESPDALPSAPPPQAARMARSATATIAMRREIRDDDKRFFMMEYPFQILVWLDSRHRTESRDLCACPAQSRRNKRKRICTSCWRQDYTKELARF